MKFTAHQRFNFKNINVHEALKALERLMISNSTGYDNIPAKLLKDASDVIQ